MCSNLIALIPARFGSDRIKLKNIRLLNGHPLLAYAIQSAIDSDIFNDIYVSSDSIQILDIAEYYGAKPIQRPSEYASNTSHDAEWLNHAITTIGDVRYYAIIRPTNPFRTGETIIKSYKQWDKYTPMKAIEPAKQHAHKSSWVTDGKYMCCKYGGDDHLKPTQTLPLFYCQNGCIEWRYIHSKSVRYQAFYTEDYEGFDLNTIEDWILAVALIEKEYVKLPGIERKPYEFAV